MAWERILEKEQLELIIDNETGHLMIETSSGGAVPRYITIHIHSELEIDEIIAALKKAKQLFIQLNNKNT